MPVAIAYIVVVLLWGTTPLAIKLYIVSLLGTVCAMAAIYWATRFIGSGLISVLFGLAPIIGGLFAAIWLNERFFSVRKIVGMLCALTGLAVIFRQELALDGNNWKGVLGVLAGVTLYSFGSVWIKRLGGGYSSLTVNTGSLMATFSVFFVIWLCGGATWPAQASIKSIGAIVYLGVFGSFVGYVCYYYVLQHVQASSALLVSLMTPIIALFLGRVLNGETMHTGVWLGSAMVLTGLLVYLSVAVKAVLLIALQKIKTNGFNLQW